MSYLWSFLIFWIGSIVGFLIRSWLNYRFTRYSGTLVVIDENDRKLYSLELFGDVEDLEHYNSVTFKIIVPEKNVDRD